MWNSILWTYINMILNISGFFDFAEWTCKLCDNGNDNKKSV